ERRRRRLHAVAIEEVVLEVDEQERVLPARHVHSAADSWPADSRPVGPRPNRVTSSAIALASSRVPTTVDSGPAMSGVRRPRPSTRGRASSTTAAAWGRRRLSRSSSASDRICATGLAWFVPARSYAAPCPVWYTARPAPPKFAESAIPREPSTSAA